MGDDAKIIQQSKQVRVRICTLGAHKSAMKKHRLLFGLALVLSSLGLTSCYDDPDFSLTPNLTFRGIEQRTLRNAQNIRYDSLILVVRFQDGDGNLGLSETIFPEDEAPPFNPEKLNVPQGPGFHNILCDLYKKANGKYIKITNQAGKSFYNGRFPRVSTDKRSEPLEGDIRYSISIYENPSRENPIQKGDTIRFSIQIMDRDLNKSQVVNTDDIIFLSKE
ncbi:hypothetical protein ACD591_10730 [Rufibacter glacialis]|uniref:Uncharacterized protein n=1 Tax=Rufibacter glacialis TaxID=1259555 RepID=A0A5M8Q7A1_9BACT|nr:hypothetical protein [Rufibacter glacialis]KAA6431769.1 hypothetical protein FOE74_16760 [Rufibacter glacialis]GGK81708.1 hypothetical protein GCM10011405_31910 [Rufibacter glacialis]